MTDESSMLIQHKMLAKMQDLGSFTIPCSIRGVYYGQALGDLGASSNLMPKSIFNQLRIGQSKHTALNFQLVDRSLVHPEGRIDDVLVQVD